MTARAALVYGCGAHVAYRLLTCTLAWVAGAGCSHRERETPRDQVPGLASPETVAVSRGMRTLEVRCERSCGPTQVELSRLQRSCVRDPNSTVHHLSERPPMIQLGCCSEARGAVAEACGAEASMGACLDRWASHCERGELLELEEPVDPEGPT
jgi:hypothetical protein